MSERKVIAVRWVEPGQSVDVWVWFHDSETQHFGFTDPDRPYTTREFPMGAVLVVEATGKMDDFGDPTYRLVDRD